MLQGLRAAMPEEHWLSALLAMASDTSKHARLSCKAVCG